MNGTRSDLIFENVAHINLGKGLEVLAPFGRVVVGRSCGPIQVNPRDTMRNESDVVPSVHALLILKYVDIYVCYYFLIIYACSAYCTHTLSITLFTVLYTVARKFA